MNVRDNAVGLQGNVLSEGSGDATKLLYFPESDLSTTPSERFCVAVTYCPRVTLRTHTVVSCVLADLASCLRCVKLGGWKISSHSFSTCNSTRCSRLA